MTPCKDVRSLPRQERPSALCGLYVVARYVGGLPIELRTVLLRNSELRSGFTILRRPASPETA